MLKDGFGRTIETLRVSITDRCNLKCLYCTINQDTVFLPKHRIMTYEEIIKISRILLDLGLSRIKLTGGEPLIRKDLPKLIEKLASLNEVKDLSLTTNGTMLTSSMAKILKEAGLHRLNISLDSLNSYTYRRITGGKLNAVLRGIDNAIESGFNPVKINTVLLKNINDSEIFDILNFAVEKSLTIRFIEEMPFSKTPYSGVSNDTVFSMLKPYLETDKVVKDDKSPGPAVTFKVKGSNAKIGFISPFSRPFCMKCNRIRLSTDGKILPCIATNKGVDILSMIRNHSPDQIIIDKIKESLMGKKLMHDGFKNPLKMNLLGG